MRTCISLLSVHGAAPDYPSKLCPIRWRRCSFLTPLGSTHDLQVLLLKTNLWWLGICSHWASVMEQTTSNNPVIWHSAEFQEPTESLLLLMDHFVSFAIHLKRGRSWIGLHVTALIIIIIIFISLKLTTNILYMNGNCWKGFYGQKSEVN